MASPSPSAPSVPEDSVEPVNDPTSPNPEDTSQNSQDPAHGTMASVKAKLKAFHASRQGAPSARPQGDAGSTTNSPARHGGNVEDMPPGSANPGGRLIPVLPSSSVGARDEKTPAGDESGNPRDVTSQSGSLSEPRTGTKKDEDKGEAVDSASRVTGNENAEIAQ
jgi:hypothetical protein